MTHWRVLMLGPSPLNRGGIATVEDFYIRAWDYTRFEMKHITTLINGSTFAKFFVACRAILQCCYWLVFWRPHIVHIHFATEASFYRKSVFVLLTKLFWRKLILHCHAYDFATFYQRHNALGQNFIRFVLNSADRLLVVANQWRTYFESLSLNVPVVTLYNPTFCPPDVARAKSNEPIVLSLGRLNQRKGTYDTLQAIPQVLKSCPDVRFWFGGDGDVDRVSEIVSAAPWGKRVHLLGWVRGRSKEKVLRQANIFLLPSYFEGLPMAILEAMAYGLPVVSTAVGGIPEVITDDVTGFLVEPGDIAAITNKIVSLIQNPTLQERISTEAQQYVKDKFEINTILHKLYEIYDSLEPAFVES